MDIEQVFTTYWSQTVLLLAVVSYFGKRFFDLKAKQKEINHSLFQQRKLDAVNNFFLKYSETELMWDNLEIYSILEDKFSSSELDEIIYSKLNELRKSEIELQIYFKEKEYNMFVRLVESMWTINGVLKKVYFNQEVGEKRVFGVYAFQEQLKEVKEKNNLALKEVTAEVRNLFT